MEWVETTGRTVEEAKEAALDRLGVAEDDAEFEILDEPRQGLFGRVRGEARVRARVRPSTPRQKVDRRRARKPKFGAKRSGGPSEPDAPDKLEAPTVPTTPVPVEGSGATRSRRTRSGTTTSSTEAANEAATHASAKEQVMNDVSVAEQAEVVAEFLDGLLDAFGVEAAIEQAEIDEDTIEIRVTGRDLGLLIGPKGQTLQAVQELGRSVAQRRLPGPHKGRVRVDIGGYRQRRAEALERFTREVAATVLAEGTRKVLEPMSAPDRKVVHDVVNTIDGVRTISEGEEPRRRVVILPD